MDIIQLVGEIVVSIFKHGWSVTTFVVALTALLRVNSVRRALLRRLPRRFRHEDRLDRIEHKLDALMSTGGVTWDADLMIGKNAANVTDGVKKTSILSQAGYALAGFTKSFTRVTAIFHLRGKTTMKSKFLSRKFLMAVISAALVIANDGLELGLDQNTIVAFGSIVVGWIVSEAVVDVSGKEKNIKFGDSGPAE